MLRFRILAAFVLLLAFSPLHAQKDPALSDNLHTATQLELDVVKVILKQEAAWNRGDIDGYAEGYKDSPDTLLVSDNIQRGFATLVDHYKRAYPNRDIMGQLTFSGLEVHPVDDKIAICIGRYHLQRSKKSGGDADGLFTLVFEKTDKGWKIVLDHTT
jgi:ketosteroid isomerase-like protein